MKKKIGISYSESNFQNYWNWFTTQDLGDSFELVELSFEKDNTDDIAACSGFVLTGGIDVVPSLYGGVEDYPFRPKNFLPKRDEFEAKIYIHSQNAKIPLLGICRGMQYVNILEGGNVYEDNGEEVNLQHKNAGEDKVHDVCIEKESLLYDIVKVIRGSVNSAHHQAVKPTGLGNNLMVTAYAEAPFRIIEALEFKDKSEKAFMLCVQWHPERMKEEELNPLSQKIKERFLAEVKNKS